MTKNAVPKTVRFLPQIALENGEQAQVKSRYPGMGVIPPMSVGGPCHDQRHAALYGEGVHDKNCLTEELDELETLMSSSGGGQEGVIPLA